ncbi:hypothetical protein RHDC4_00928 [Rhodocyclaceae bacterium]|nr:hypothetical protein RHDC4_00928 [Rhodocyclaceae bacterium]
MNRAYLKGKAFLDLQLSFAFTFGKRLIRSAKRGFIWIRPDGRQIWCPSIASLKSAVLNYSGGILTSLLYQAMRIRGRGGLYGYSPASA